MALADYTLANVKGVKKSFDMSAAADILKYKDARLFNIQDTTEWTEIFNSTESMTGVTSLTELQAPTVLNLEEGYTVTLASSRFGGAITITEDDMTRAQDSTVLIDQFIQRKRDALLKEANHYFITEIFEMYNDAFNSGADTLAPDGVELCGVHLWSTGASYGFTNYSTAVLSEQAIADLEEYAGALTDASGKPMPQSFNTIVVKKGSVASREAKKIFGMRGMVPTSVGDINIYEGEYTLIETPYITAAHKTYWFALALSQFENPLYVGITKMPAMNTPVIALNNSVTSNATGYFKKGITNMPINVYGSTGTV
jgi:hypothetical protein